MKIKENVTRYAAENEEKVKMFSVFEQSVTSKYVCFYLNGVIEDPQNYAEMIHRIRMASANDVIEIHLNTPGGELDTGIQLINAMKSSAAHIITVLDSRAYSLGTLIFLSGDEYQVHDHCTMMFHNFSSQTYGKGNEQQSELDMLLKWFNKLMHRICHPFLSAEEIKRILKGEDIWLDTDEIRKRLNKIFPNTTAVKRLKKKSAEVAKPKEPPLKKEKEEKQSGSPPAKAPAKKPKG